jgi:hypothetical protein
LTVTQLERLESKVLRLLRNEARPISTTDLLGKHGDSAMISPEDLRRAVWNLVRDGKAEYTNDRRLIVSK